MQQQVQTKCVSQTNLPEHFPTTCVTQVNRCKHKSVEMRRNSQTPKPEAEHRPAGTELPKIKSRSTEASGPNWHVFLKDCLQYKNNMATFDHVVT